MLALIRAIHAELKGADWQTKTRGNLTVTNYSLHFLAKARIVRSSDFQVVSLLSGLVLANRFPVAVLPLHHPLS
ncbi:hypothetical protein [Sulfuricystis multivorans]|uniref:hypothetical protein n=1 Tax=Sulfuricystis multivorans TaxID=2211108 RepID=UPI000F848A12|nr:hypothetical protein [Sulfuricystis multivorans]